MPICECLRVCVWNDAHSSRGRSGESFPNDRRVVSWCVGLCQNGLSATATGVTQKWNTHTMVMREVQCCRLSEIEMRRHPSSECRQTVQFDFLWVCFCYFLRLPYTSRLAPAAHGFNCSILQRVAQSCVSCERLVTLASHFIIAQTIGINTHRRKESE